MSYYTKMKTKSIFIYIYRYVYIYTYIIIIIEFKQIRFSSEVSLMYKQEKKVQREEQRKKTRKITLTEVLQYAVCGAARVLPETHWVRRCRLNSQSL